MRLGAIGILILTIVGMLSICYCLLRLGFLVVDKFLERSYEMEKTKCCGTCKFHKRDENFQEDWICCNDKSENYADWTEYEDVCDDWED